jgi:hypothetical protein
MATFAAGMVMPVVSGPMVRMQAGQRSKTAKPKKEEGKNFLEQLGEWTQKSSLKETDPLLKKVAEEKKAPANASAPPPEKKGFFGF